MIQLLVNVQVLAKQTGPQNKYFHSKQRGNSPQLADLASFWN